MCFSAWSDILYLKKKEKLFCTYLLNLSQNQLTNYANTGTHSPNKSMEKSKQIPILSDVPWIGFLSSTRAPDFTEN